MPRFTCEVTFSLTTEVEFDGHVEFDESEVEDFSDNSYWGGQTITCDDGSATFVVEATDEYEAEEKALAVIPDGSEMSDYSGITWMVEHVSASVEEIEEPMTLAKALDILKKMLARLAEGGTITTEEQEAFA